MSKTKSTALYAAAGALGVGALAFAFWPRPVPYRVRKAESVSEFQASDYCAKYWWTAECGGYFDFDSYLEAVQRRPQPTPDPDPTYNSPGGDPYLELD